MNPSLTDMLDSFPEGWRPQPGDKLIGIVIALETRTTEYGDYPIVNVRTDGGRDVETARDDRRALAVAVAGRRQLRKP